MNLSLKLNKKIRYAVVSSVGALFLFVLSLFVNTDLDLLLIVLLLTFGPLAGVIISQYVSKFSALKISSYAFLVILLVHLFVGYLATSYYFPNLGPLVRAIGLLGVAGAIYSILLVNNIFIVIEEKGGLIPLYTVALTWVQVISIIISIPFFSGVFKIPTTFYFQNTLVLVSAFLLNFYTVWCISFDPSSKRTAIGEKMLVSGFLAFCLAALGVSVSFIPTESFLRGLFMSSGLLFSLNYIHAHYKNRLDIKFIRDYGLIIIFFFIVLLLFRP